METNTKITLTIVLGSIVVLGIIIGLSFLNTESSVQLTQYSSDDTSKPKIEIKEKSFDFGEVDPKDEVIHEFKFENTGKSNLEITDIITSCMCTIARVIINGQKSPEFGMHGGPKWIGEIAPGQSGTIEVVFDPDFHKGVKGAVTRTISFTTNDPHNQEIELMIGGSIN